MRVLVCGGRDFDDYALVEQELGKLNISCLIHGAARGADSLGAKYAALHGIPVQAFPADWKRYGRGAGPIRNAQMLREGKPDVVVAFLGGRGTAHIVALAHHNHVRVTSIT
jgi:hypothetical protein